jgi:hypothetical protein
MMTLTDIKKGFEFLWDGKHVIIHLINIPSHIPDQKFIHFHLASKEWMSCKDHERWCELTSLSDFIQNPRITPITSGNSNRVDYEALTTKNIREGMIVCDARDRNKIGRICKHDGVLVQHHNLPATVFVEWNLSVGHYTHYRDIRIIHTLLIVPNQNNQVHEQNSEKREQGSQTTGPAEAQIIKVRRPTATIICGERRGGVEIRGKVKAASIRR